LRPSEGNTGRDRLPQRWLRPQPKEEKLTADKRGWKDRQRGRTLMLGSWGAFPAFCLIRVHPRSSAVKTLSGLIFVLSNLRKLRRILTDCGTDASSSSRCSRGLVYHVLNRAVGRMVVFRGTRGLFLKTEN
jgi:hypothetical protein